MCGATGTQPCIKAIKMSMTGTHTVWWSNRLAPVWSSTQTTFTDGSIPLETVSEAPRPTSEIELTAHGARVHKENKKQDFFTGALNTVGFPPTLKEKRPCDHVCDRNIEISCSSSERMDRRRLHVRYSVGHHDQQVFAQKICQLA